MFKTKFMLNNLKVGDYIAFGFNYNGGIPTEIIVSDITSIEENEVLVHFLYGYKSMSEYIKKEDIIALGNMDGQDKIIGWSGNFDIIQPQHKLLNK